MKVGRIRTIILITVILALAVCLLPEPAGSMSRFRV